MYFSSNDQYLLVGLLKFYFPDKFSFFGRYLLIFLEFLSDINLNVTILVISPIAFFWVVTSIWLYLQPLWSNIGPLYTFDEGLHLIYFNDNFEILKKLPQFKDFFSLPFFTESYVFSISLVAYIITSNLEINFLSYASDIPAVGSVLEISKYYLKAFSPKESELIFNVFFLDNILMEQNISREYLFTDKSDIYDFGYEGKISKEEFLELCNSSEITREIDKIDKVDLSSGVFTITLLCSCFFITSVFFKSLELISLI
jgi:hypothetical protein